VPNVDRYLLPIILVIVAISFVPVFLELFRMRRGGHDDERVTEPTKP
jgi:membrane-associated protein